MPYTAQAAAATQSECPTASSVQQVFRGTIAMLVASYGSEAGTRSCLST